MIQYFERNKMHNKTDDGLPAPFPGKVLKRAPHRSLKDMNVDSPDVTDDDVQVVIQNVEQVAIQDVALASAAGAAESDPHARFG